jgi:hypothetical protein
MKDEDASRIASSLDRIATGLEQLNELLQRKTQAAKAGFPRWVWAVGMIGAGLFIWSVVRTGSMH